MQGVQTVLPIGPDGLPIGLGGTGGLGGSGGTGADSAIDVKVSNLAATTILQVQLDLATARTAAPLDLPGMKTVFGFTVRRLSGADAAGVKVHAGGITAPGLAVDEGEARDALNVSGLCVTNPGAGGALQLEVYGA